MKPSPNMSSLDQHTSISKILCLFLFIVVERHVQQYFSDTEMENGSVDLLLDTNVTGNQGS